MITRRGLLAGGLAGGAAVLAGCGGREEAVARDADVLARPLAVKRRLVEAYEAIDRPLARQIAAHERDHAGRLERAIRAAGGARAAAPAPGSPSGRPLEAALALERLAVATLLEALPRLGDVRLRSLAAAMLTADAQHASVVLDALGRDPLPDAFAQGRLP